MMDACVPRGRRSQEWPGPDIQGKVSQVGQISRSRAVRLSVAPAADYIGSCLINVRRLKANPTGGSNRLSLSKVPGKIADLKTRETVGNTLLPVPKVKW